MGRGRGRREKGKEREVGGKKNEREKVTRVSCTVLQLMPLKVSYPKV